MKRIMWTPIPPVTNAQLPHVLGLIVDFVDQLNDEPASKQIDRNYQHGGGWRPRPEWSIRFVKDEKVPGDVVVAQYPGDPPMRSLARAIHQSERLFMFPRGYMCIVQQDGSFEMARLD